MPKEMKNYKPINMLIEYPSGYPKGDPSTIPTENPSLNPRSQSSSDPDVLN